MKAACIYFFVISVFAPLCAADIELSVEFRNHPDRSGSKTTNQSISMEDGEVEIDFGGPEGEMEREVSDEEFAAVLALVQKAVNRFECVEGEEMEGAYVEVKLEFEGEDREIEVTEIFKAGSVPEQYVTLQEKYFETIYR